MPKYAIEIDTDKNSFNILKNGKNIKEIDIISHASIGFYRTSYDNETEYKSAHIQWGYTQDDESVTKSIGFSDSNPAKVQSSAEYEEQMEKDLDNK